MKPDISAILQTMSPQEIAAHIQEAKAILEKKRDEARKEFLEEFRAKAEILGLSIENLIVGMRLKNQTQKTKGGQETFRSIPIKYRDPQTPENTWTGRGLRPRWLREKLELGAKIEDFHVN